MSGTADREFSAREGFAFLVAMIGVQLSSELFAQWGTYFYSPSGQTGRTIYVGIGLVAYIFIVGRAVDIFTDPLIGVWSDRLRRRTARFGPAGRRRPFIFWGSILMTSTGIAFWYPPVADASAANFGYGTGLMSLHWVFYTLAYIPILALAPEIARSAQARVRLGTWIAVGMVVGLALAALLPGVLIDVLDPARRAPEAGYSAAGYQRVAVIFAAATLGCFQFFVWSVREPASPPTEASRTPAATELLRAFRNKLFLLYFAIFFLYYMGILAAQRALPYWAELGLGGNEATVSLLGIPFILSALAAALACPLLNRWMDLKWILVLALASGALSLPLMYPVAVADIADADKIRYGMLIFALNGIGVGMIYVLMTPLIGQIIDIGEKTHGERREAVFNALHTMMVKGAQVLAIWIAVTSMGVLGNTIESPQGVFAVGPVAGVFCLAALAASLAYPRVDRRETAPEALMKETAP